MSTRQLHGALNRVPPLFYEKGQQSQYITSYMYIPAMYVHISIYYIPIYLHLVYNILTRAEGINVRGKTLLQVSVRYIATRFSRWKEERVWLVKVDYLYTHTHTHTHTHTQWQVPTVYEVNGQEVQFALKVEELLSTITIPEYRQVVVEVCPYYLLILKLKLYHSLPLRY